MQHALRNALALPLLTLALAAVGCGGDDDSSPTGSGGGGGTPITASNIAQVQTALSTTLTSVAGKGPGTYDGARSGRVKIEMSTGKLAAQAFAYSLDFDNYSDDGQLYIGGKITYQLSGTSVHYYGDLEFSGAYSGDVELDITAGQTGASGTYRVNGATITL